MHRRQLLHHALTAPAWTLAACSTAAPLRLGIQPWIGHEPLFLARELNWLPASVQFEVGNQASDSLDGLHQGRLDAAALTLDEMLKARSDGLPLLAVLILDTSAGADMVLALPELTRLQDLRGRRLAVERSAVGRLMLLKALEAAGLALHEVQVVTMRLDEQTAAWQRRQIDAAISYEPTASRLMREGAHRLFDSRALPETIFDVLAVRRDRLHACRGAIEAAVAGHLRGLFHLRVNRPDAAHRIATRNGITLAEVGQALAGVALPDLARNKVLMAPAPSMLGALHGLNELMVAQGLLPRPDPLHDVFDASFLPATEPQA